MRQGLFVFCNAGFVGGDTAVNDPNGGFRLETNDFTQVGQALAALQLPTLIVQEGGYILESIGANVLAFLQGVV